MGFDISFKEFKCIRDRHQQGESVSHISRTQSRSIWLIEKVLRAREYVPQSRSGAVGRKSKTSAREERRVRREILRQSTRRVPTTARRIATQSGVRGLIKTDVLYRVKALELKSQRLYAKTRITAAQGLRS
ncbi:hypothetical protein Ciccas_012232 [Cichlidogyrus casuarinus]|uniref:Transposase IS30-like HTH domain-containing protein n=1 Tax=Cichlidogyrus casuarinus TaxID=1844966 RepID=A0ABD2PRA0_9PLAT